MKRIKRFPWKKICFTASAMGVTGFLLILLINHRVNKIAEGKLFTDIRSVPEKDVAVVLGTSRYLTNGYENEFFKKRIDAAAELYLNGKVKKILVSGDNSIRSYNEPRDMRNALIERGVCAEDIVLDYAGFRTYDSMVRAKEVFGLNSFIVVSQEFHCERAIYIARSKDMLVTGYIAADPITRSTKTYLREYPARVNAFLDCYILKTKPHFLGEKIDVLAQR